jgi:eukaryotic-like serine/threonine-protein kinase
MTPERWRRIDELFAGALRLDPAARDAWLREACGDDEGLRAEVARLLDQDEKATRDRFLITPEPPGRAPEQTGSWYSHGGHRTPRRPGRIDDVGAGPVAVAGGFSPKAVIAAGPRPLPVSESESVVRARLRELPMIYILLLAMATFWRCVVLGDNDRVLHYLDATVIAVLVGVMALLSGPWHVPLARLKALELGVIGLLAGRVAIAEYRLVLIFSGRDDPVMAQMTAKNFMLLTSVLMLTCGLYVPKTWRRAALVVGPLALLPFATLAVLFLQHPETMSWLGRGWGKRETPRFLLFGFDAMTLLILVVGCAFGARAISRLRRQVAEAQQLGQYRLRRQIGGGGMGEVYLAEHQLLKRPCAIKLIRPDSAADPKAVARFEREVRLTATLSHPNTVEIYDYGRTEDGTYYYVMEYLPGLTLTELVERHGPLPAGRAVYLLRQVCGALREAHAAGLIHRDIKPSNIFAARCGGVDDVAKLLDFGLVLPVAKRDAPQLSGEGRVLGTPQFMSPEQAKGDAELDGRSDIYSLGAVAYYLLTGRPPFVEEDGIRLLIAHARDPVVPPSLICANIPRDLERVVLRCLAKDPADRFPDSESLERALGKCRCVGDWDQDRASQWWQAADRAPATRATVTELTIEASSSRSHSKLNDP